MWLCLGIRPSFIANAAARKSVDIDCRRISVPRAPKYLTERAVGRVRRTGHAADTAAKPKPLTRLSSSQPGPRRLWYQDPCLAPLPKNKTVGLMYCAGAKKKRVVQMPMAQNAQPGPGGHYSTWRPICARRNVHTLLRRKPELTRAMASAHPHRQVSSTVCHRVTATLDFGIDNYPTLMEGTALYILQKFD